ncbi:hypothetical protein ACWEWX_53340 [Streptomyces asiaticus]
MSSPEFTLLFITVAVGALLQVAIGFGLGLLAAPVIAIFAPSLTPVAVLLLATGVTAAVLVDLHRRRPHHRPPRPTPTDTALRTATPPCPAPS